MMYFIIIGYKDEQKFYFHICDNGFRCRFRENISEATIMNKELLYACLEDIKDEAALIGIYDLRPAKISIKEYKTI